MPGSTPIHNLPYPLGNETADPRAAIQALAEATEDAIPSIPDVPVTSVNGETGAVELSAADVGAADATAFAEHQADYVYQVAGGTATAITITISETLVDGLPMAFIVSADNGAAATTINTKPLYKPNTTDAPNLVTGKAYTVWYNQTGDCFFIKASAEGDAVVADVLAGKKFSNDNDTGLTGTMPNRSGDTVALSSSVSGTTLKLLASNGYRDGVDDNVTITDADFIAGNIKNGIDIFGLVGNYAAKRFASGLATSDSGAVLGVSGLAFTPSVVLAVRNGAITNFASYWAPGTNGLPANHNINAYGLIGGTTGTSGYTNVGSGYFNLAVYTPSASYYWVAIE